MHSWMRLLAGILPLLQLLHCEIIVDRPDSNYKVLCLVGVLFYQHFRDVHVVSSTCPVRAMPQIAHGYLQLA